MGFMSRIGPEIEHVVEHLVESTKRFFHGDRVEISKEDDPNIKRPKNDSRNVSSDDKQEISTYVSIALVLKAKEARGLKDQIDLDLETVKQLLDNASYFLCILKKEMADKWQELQCNEDINFLSEQPIVVRIDLQHRGLPKQFKTKLELKRYLLEGGTEFKYYGCMAIIKPILIKKVGFQRS
jgi:hypothetical protein